MNCIKFCQYYTIYINLRFVFNSTLILCPSPDVCNNSLLLAETDMFFSKTASGANLYTEVKVLNNMVLNCSLKKINAHEHFARVFTRIPIDVNRVNSYLEDPKRQFTDKRKLPSTIKTTTVYFKKNCTASIDRRNHSKEQTNQEPNQNESKLIVRSIIDDILMRLDGSNNVTEMYGDLFEPFWIIFSFSDCLTKFMLFNYS